MRNAGWATSRLGPAPGNAGEDARRKLAAEQERLADRTDRLGESVETTRSGAAAQPEEKQAMTEAGRELDRQNLSGAGCASRRRRCDQGQPSGNGEPEPGTGMTPTTSRSALDKVADQLETGRRARCRGGDDCRTNSHARRSFAIDSSRLAENDGGDSQGW